LHAAETRTLREVNKGILLRILFFCPAFAELQTDMTDLTADLESSGIPTLDHKNYIMKVFFPGVSDHPILNDPKVRRYLDG
jgi:hypothetical protein